MEKDFDAKLKIQGNSSNGGNVQRSKSFAFRAPQEQFTIQDFELGKIYGVGSYSKVCAFVLFSFFYFFFSLLVLLFFLFFYSGIGCFKFVIFCLFCYLVLFVCVSVLFFFFKEKFVACAGW